MKPRSILPLIGGLIALLAIAVLPQVTIVSATGSNVEVIPSTETEVCPDNEHEPHYFFGDEPKEGENSFGPAAEGEATEEMIEELVVRLCGDGETHSGDPALFAAIQAAANPFLDSNRELTRQEWRDQLAEFVASIKVEESSVTSQVDGDTTMMMVDGDNERPRIEATPYDTGRGGNFLVLVLQSSNEENTLRLRAECGFQPVW